MINAYIFTRNRAAQLHLLLSSLGRNLPGVFEPYVVWRADSPEFRRGYELLMSRSRHHAHLPAGKFVEDTGSPREDFLRGCEYSESTSGLVAVFTDDCVAYRPTKILPGDIETVMGLEKVRCASLRLGQNTIVQNYLTGETQPSLDKANPVLISPYWGEQEDQDHEDWLAWGYEQFDYRLNYGYAAGMDGHVYRARDLLDSVLQMERMDTYRDWEGCWHQPARRRQWAAKRPWMACPETSCVVNIPANSVQVDPTPSGTVHGVSARHLNDLYLAGEVIDLDAFDFSAVRSCHAEFPFAFRKF